MERTDKLVMTLGAAFAVIALFLGWAPMAVIWIGLSLAYVWFVC